MERDSSSPNFHLIETLTPRERDVLRLLAQHLRYLDIAEQLTMAISSVKWFAQQIYGKLGVDNRRDAIQRAQELGLLETAQASAPIPDTKPRHNLPRSLTRFIGREKEIGQVLDLVRQKLLVTLSGAGGVGKTRLAQVVAGELALDFQHGAWLVELAPLADEKLVAQTVAGVFGIQISGDGDYLSLLVQYLREKQLLLILDNCEHLLEGSARLAETLLSSCPQLTLLVTSREGLGVPGEVKYRVPSLQLPSPGGSGPSRIVQSEAVELFLERASAVSSGLRLEEANLAAVERICRRLDGIPLAIELAAARVEVLSVDEIASRLDDRFHLLTGGSRTALPRHRTLYASIDWSFSLLAEPERMLFQRLSIFSGGWSLEESEQICADTALPEGQVLDTLAALVNKSLVLVEEEKSGGRHYRLLETIRQYAHEKLAGAGELAQVAERHAHYYFRFGQNLEAGSLHYRMLRRQDQAAWFTRIDGMLDNIRAALQWSREDDPQEGLDLLSALTSYWHNRNTFDEAMGWFEKLLAIQARQISPAGLGPLQIAAGWDRRAIQVRARAMERMGNLMLPLEISPKAESLLQESQALFSSLGAEGRRGAAYARLWQAGFAEWRMANAEACQIANECIHVFRDLDDDYGTCECLSVLGNCLPDAQAAAAAAQEWLSLAQKYGDQDGISFAYENFADKELQIGNYAQAVNLYTASLEGFRAIGNWRFAVTVLKQLCLTYLRLKDFENAHLSIREGQDISQAKGDLAKSGNFLFWEGVIHQSQDRLVEALDSFRASTQKAREFDDTNGIVESLYQLGLTHMRLGNSLQASPFFEECFSLSFESKIVWALRPASVFLAWVYVLQGRSGEIADVIRKVAAMDLDPDPDRMWLVEYLDIAAGQALRVGDLAQSARLSGAASRHNPIADNQNRTVILRKFREADLDALRTALDPQFFEQAWKDGVALTREAAIEEVRHLLG